MVQRVMKIFKQGIIMDNVNNYGFLLLQKMLSFTNFGADKCKEIIEDAMTGNKSIIKELAELTHSNEDDVDKAINTLRKTTAGQTKNGK